MASQCIFPFSFTFSPPNAIDLNSLMFWTCPACKSSNVCDGKQSSPQCANCAHVRPQLLSSSPSLSNSKIPFFLKKPKIEYFIRTSDVFVDLRFQVHLTDATGTLDFGENVSKLKLTVTQSTNLALYPVNFTEILQASPTAGAGVFQMVVHYPFYGTLHVSLVALVEYAMTPFQWDMRPIVETQKAYAQESMPADLVIQIPNTARQTEHQEELAKFVLTANEFECAQQQQHQQGYNRLSLIELDETSDEYRTICFEFVDSSKHSQSDFEKLQIYKIHHQHRLEAYQNKKRQMLQSLNNDVGKLHELQLYHGTELQSITKILHQGFLRQFASRAVYGKGIYFASKAAYSLSTAYSKPDKSDFQHLLLCSVLCGEWTVGTSCMRIPPNKPQSHFVPYETTVNKQHHPSIFVTYQDDQALPLYLISCKQK